MNGSIALGPEGHFPGCAVVGCHATRCADARLVEAMPRGPRTVPITLTHTQTRTAREITGAWNADRRARGLEPLTLAEAVGEILCTVHGLVCGTGARE